MQNPRPHDICTSLPSYKFSDSPKQYNIFRSSHLVLVSVERIPDTSHTLVQTLDRLGDPLELLAARAAQQGRFFQNLVRLHVAHADGFLLAADIFSFEDGVSAWSGRDCHFDLRVGAGEFFEVGFEELAGRILLDRFAEKVEWTSILHSPAATGPVAVVEVDALALEDEGADAVLGDSLARVGQR